MTQQQELLETIANYLIPHLPQYLKPEIVRHKIVIAATGHILILAQPEIVIVDSNWDTTILALSEPTFLEDLLNTVNDHIFRVNQDT